MWHHAIKTQRNISNWTELSEILQVFVSKGMFDAQRVPVIAIMASATTFRGRSSMQAKCDFNKLNGAKEIIISR